MTPGDAELYQDPEASTCKTGRTHRERAWASAGIQRLRRLLIRWGKEAVLLLALGCSFNDNFLK